MPNTDAITDLRLAIGVLAMETTSKLSALADRLDEANRGRERDRAAAAEQSSERDEVARDQARELGRLAAAVARLQAPTKTTSGLDLIPTGLDRWARMPRRPLVALSLVVVVALFMSPLLAFVVLEHAHLMEMVIGAARG